MLDNFTPDSVLDDDDIDSADYGNPFATAVMLLLACGFCLVTWFLIWQYVLPVIYRGLS